MRGEYFLITGTGKTGTSWLSKALHHPNAGIICLDEGKFPSPNRLRGGLRKIEWLRRFWTRYRKGHSWLSSVDGRFLGWDKWLDVAEYELECGLGSKFDSYFRLIESRLSSYVSVGDSHSWDPHMIPLVTERIKVSRIIHLVRNGIPNVHALALHNAELFARSTVIKRQIDHYRDIFGGDYSSDWEHWCFWWAINSLIPNWLRLNLPEIPVDVYRLEDLTKDLVKLEKIIEELNPGSLTKITNLRSIQVKNDNRDKSGNQNSRDIWSQWSDEQRNSFRRICAEAMEFYGYDIPS